MASSSGLFESVSSEPTPKRVKLSGLDTNEQIEAMKEEIRGRIKSIRDRLDAKECELIAEVDRLGALQVSARDELEEQIRELDQGRTALKSTSNRSNQVRSAVELAIEDLDRFIRGISQKLEQFQEIQSSWKTEELESNIDSLCSLSNVTNVESIYQCKSDPIWKVGFGEGPSQLSSPTSLAIQQSTADVFVGDRDGNRIQVYNSLGEHIRSIEKFYLPLNVFYVDDISILAVTNNQYRKVEIVELNLHTLKVRNIEVPGSFTLYSDLLTCFTANTRGCIQHYEFYDCASKLERDSTKLKHDYTRKGENCIINFRDSKNLSSSPPSSPIISNFSCLNVSSNPLPPQTNPVGISSDGKNIYILVADYKQLVLEYDTECKFIRSFCPSSLLNTPQCVCVDSRGNILVAGSEGESTKILCLSPDGDVIQELQIPYEQCISIAVNSQFHISILCRGESHGIITF